MLNGGRKRTVRLTLLLENDTEGQGIPLSLNDFVTLVSFVVRNSV
jgi:hypothetical protein